MGRTKKVYIEIDGAFMNAEISVNGNVASIRPNGYSAYHTRNIRLFKLWKN